MRDHCLELSLLIVDIVQRVVRGSLALLRLDDFAVKIGYLISSALPERSRSRH